MGMPADDLERSGGADGNAPRQMAIPRRFAIATTEVTVSQFQKFLKATSISIPRYNLPASFLTRVLAGPGWSLDRPRLVYRGPLLQLAK